MANQLSTRPLVGVAIALSDPDLDQLHLGLCHCSGEQPIQFLHLAWHGMLQQEDVPIPAHKGIYAFIELQVEPDRIDAVTTQCRRVWARHHKSDPIPYGLLYDNGTFAVATGKLDLGSSRGVGLTCATFVLAVLKGAGIELLQLPWPERPIDAAWHDRIIGALGELRRVRPDCISEAHFESVKAEKGCARYRPEEVAAACSFKQLPVSFTDAAALGSTIAAALIGANHVTDLRSWT